MNTSYKFSFTKLILCFMVFLAVPALGCNKDKSDEVQNANKLRQQKMDTKGLDKQEIDINGDGKPDQFIYTKDGQMRYAQRDFNFDQVLDMTEFYDEKGNHTSDEIDLDYDGIVDLVITYQNDLPIRKEYSIDFEGNRHGVQLFDAKGNRVEIHRDTNRDGKADLVEYYRPGEAEPYKTETIHTNVDLSKTANLAGSSQQTTDADKKDNSAAAESDAAQSETTATESDTTQPDATAVESTGNESAGADSNASSTTETDNTNAQQNQDNTDTSQK